MERFEKEKLSTPELPPDIKSDTLKSKESAIISFPNVSSICRNIGEVTENLIRVSAEVSINLFHTTKSTSISLETQSREFVHGRQNDSKHSIKLCGIHLTTRSYLRLSGPTSILHHKLHIHQVRMISSGTYTTIPLKVRLMATSSSVML